MTKKAPVFELPFQPHEIPSVRIGAAIANHSDRRLCFVVGGGLGDRVCAEPTLRYALDHYREKEISLVCETPQLFRHLKFREVFDLKKTFPVMGRHLLIHTYSQSPLFNQFVNANLTHCVDYPSLASLRMQLPISYKRIRLERFPSPAIQQKAQLGELHKGIAIHPGESWPSRTFPAEWWLGVIRAVLNAGFKPWIIGTKTVELGELPNGCYDLRGQTDIDDFAWICMCAYGVVTNDSSPLHLAAPGEGRIAFVSTVRNPDLLLHYRRGGFGWRMKDFNQNQVWQLYDFCPNHLNALTLDKLPAGIEIEELLPQPIKIVEWLSEKETQNV